MLRRLKAFLIDLGLSLLIIIGLIVLLWSFGVDRQAVIISLLLMGAFLVMISASNATVTKRLDADAKKMLDGAYWVHWRYDASFWRQHAPERWFNQHLRHHKLAWSMQLRMALIPTILISTVGFFIMNRSGTVQQTLQVTGSVSVAAFAMIMISTHMRYRAVQHTSNNEDITVYISIDGVYITEPPKHFLRLRAPYLQLNDVVVETGSPAFLVFDAQYMLGSGEPATATLRLPIPRGHQHEAEFIAKRFRAEATGPSHVSKNTRLF